MVSLHYRLTYLELHGFQTFTKEEIESNFENTEFKRFSRKNLYRISTMNFYCMNDVITSRNGKNYYGQIIR